MELISYRLEDLKSGTIKVRTSRSARSTRPPLTLLNRFIVSRKHETTRIQRQSENIFFFYELVGFAIVLLRSIDEHGRDVDSSTW